MELASSWIPSGFISDEPQQENLICFKLQNLTLDALVKASAQACVCVRVHGWLELLLLVLLPGEVVEATSPPVHVRAGTRRLQKKQVERASPSAPTQRDGTWMGPLNPRNEPVCFGGHV